MVNAGALLTGAAGGAGVSIIISAIDNFSGTFAKMNSGLLVAGAAITGFGVLGAKAISGVTKTAIEFESAFAGVKKTVELSESEFADLRKEFKKLSTEIPVTFVELSSIGEIAGQLGVEGVANLKKFTKTIADISATTNLTAEDAATSFARIANIMQEPIANVDRMGAAVVELGNNFATTESEIVTFATRIAGAGNIAGLATSDLFAIGAAFSSVGVQAEAGGTAVQKVLIKMNTAVATSNGALQVFAETAGMSSTEFQKAWKEDAAGAFASFVTGLGEQGDLAIDTLDELKLKDARLIRSFLSLSNAGTLLTDTLNTSSIATAENTALVEEANKRYETAQSQLTIFKNKQAALSEQMGTVFLPILIKVLDKLGNFISFLEEHPKLTKFAIVALAIASALALIVGPMLIMVAMLPALSAGFGLLSASILPMVLPILAIVAALVAIGVIIAQIIKLVKRNKAKKTPGSAEGITTVEEFDALMASKRGTSSTSEFGSLSGITRKISILDSSPVLNNKKIKLDTSVNSNINNPGGLGTGGVTVNIEQLVANDAESVATMLQRELQNTINT